MAVEAAPLPGEELHIGSTANGRLEQVNGHGPTQVQALKERLDRPTNGTSVEPQHHGIVKISSPDVHYTEDHIRSKYVYRTTEVSRGAQGIYMAQPRESIYDFQVERKVGKVGLMMVGWGGNNGSTVTAGILANRHQHRWQTREGEQAPNYFGSLMMGSTIKLGIDATGNDVNIPFHHLLPMVHPNDLVLGGWDISHMNLADAMDRAKVIEPTLKQQLYSEMRTMKPLPSVFYPNFIATNQKERASNVLRGEHASTAHVAQIRQDITDFKRSNGLDKVIVIWTASTERYAPMLVGVNDTAANLGKAIEAGHAEISPSTIFAWACILEGVPFINGSPQNTFVPGVIDLAEQHGSFLGGDDFKSGQTKMKSVMVDFLINAGIKVSSIASYNHLGNNDGKNLSEQDQFRSKEISKSNVVDDMVAANQILYGANEHPDHTVVIKYMPAVGDSKRALDEYYSEIFLGGKQTVTMSNVCEDSLLASPLIIDLVVIAEVMTRIKWKVHSEDEYKSFHPVLSILSYMLKAPLTPPGTPKVNSLAKQRAALVNIFRACVGLQPESDMGLEHKLGLSKTKGLYS